MSTFIHKCHSMVAPTEYLTTRYCFIDKLIINFGIKKLMETLEIVLEGKSILFINTFTSTRSFSNSKIDYLCRLWTKSNCRKLGDNSNYFRRTHKLENLAFLTNIICSVESFPFFLESCPIMQIQIFYFATYAKSKKSWRNLLLAKRIQIYSLHVLHGFILIKNNIAFGQSNWFVT